MIGNMETLVGTLVLQQLMIKGISIVGRHTWISADNDKRYGKSSLI